MSTGKDPHQMVRVFVLMDYLGFEIRKVRNVIEETTIDRPKNKLSKEVVVPMMFKYVAVPNATSSNRNAINLRNPPILLKNSKSNPVRIPRRMDATQATTSSTQNRCIE